MTTADTEWKVSPHGPLEQVAENVWRVEGTIPRMPLRRVMTVAKREDGRLVLHSPIALDDAGMKALEALGPVAFLLVPNGYHRIDTPRFAKRYPSAAVYCPTASRGRVAKVVAVTGTYRDFPADRRVALEELDGTGGDEGVMIVRGADGLTLVLNDVLFNMPHVPGLQGLVLKHVTQSSGGPRISRIARLFLVKDKAKVRAELERLAALPDLRRVVVSHHEVIAKDPARTLREVAATL